MSKETESTATHRRLYRSEKDRIIAGVAGGLGDYFEIDPTFIRIIFVALAISGGVGIGIYILCWIFIPSESMAGKSFDETVTHSAEEVKQKAEAWAEGLRHNRPYRRDQEVWAMVIILLGIIFLLINFNVLSWSIIGRLWPLVLILIGWRVLSRPRK